ncbi:MAG: hypothetical protein JST35_10955 [Armatimonadetes bacterium]|nr:hypothetical protein [Armatimonadota bacterium]
MRPLVLLPLLATAALAQAQSDTPDKVRVTVETGYVWQNKNDVAVPRSGTNFSFPDLIGRGPTGFLRITVLTTPDAKNGWRFVLAPLSLRGTGTFSSPVSFNGTTFAANTPTDGLYQFNSWRIGYFWRWAKNERGTWRLGFTGKLRDAKVRLRQGNTVSEYSNLGFVPLLHISGETKLTEKLWLGVDFDGLAGGPGRAFDGSVTLNVPIDRRATAFIGGRFLEGGANVPATRNSALLTYITAGVTLRF